MAHPSRSILLAIALSNILLLEITSADILLPGVGVSVTENFNSFQGLGFSPAPSSGQLNSNTYRARGFSDGNGEFGGTYTSGDFARGNSKGNVSEGGAYAFEVATSNFAVGVQPTDLDFSPGEFTIRVANQTGVAISGFNLQAEAWLLNNQNRSTRFIFAVSTNDITYADFYSLDSTEAASASPAWESVFVAGTVSFVAPLANNSQFFIKITGSDFSGSGDRDEFAFDNLSLTAVPEPSSGLLLSLVAIGFSLRNSASKKRLRRTIN